MSLDLQIFNIGLSSFVKRRL